MRSSRNPSRAVQLLFEILYEKYRPKICYSPSNSNNFLYPQHDNHHLEEEEDFEQTNNNDEETKCERAFSQENIQPSRRKGHQKSRSDASGKTKSNLISNIFRIILFDLSSTFLALVLYRSREFSFKLVFLLN